MSDFEFYTDCKYFRTRECEYDGKPETIPWCSKFNVIIDSGCHRSCEFLYDHEAVTEEQIKAKTLSDFRSAAIHILKDSNNRHRLQDGNDWFICPAETIDNIIKWI